MLDRAALVNWVTSDVHDTAEGTGTDGNHDRVASVGGLGATDKTLGTVHSNASHNILAQVLLQCSISANSQIYNA